jgi:hypothetical protein
VTLLDDIDPSDTVDLEAGEWRPVPNQPTDDIHIESLITMRDDVAARLALAEAADPGTDPISHRLDEYRACIAELDEWIAEVA